MVQPNVYEFRWIRRTWLYLIKSGQMNGCSS